MKILQKPISPKHKSAMFYDGIVAVDGDYSLVTYQSGEIGWKDEVYIDKQIINLAKSGFINDDNIETEDCLEIYVDKFITFAYKGNVGVISEASEITKYFYNNYDEAIKAFEHFMYELKFKKEISKSIELKMKENGLYESFPTLKGIEFTYEQKNFLCSIINNFGIGEHPVANTETLQFFGVKYILDIIKTKKFREARSNNLTDIGKEILNGIVKIIKNKKK